MNIEISFYQCDETIAKSVAPLLLKVLDENKKALIVAEDQIQIKEIDASLWSYGKNKFIPHITIYDKEFAKDFDLKRQPIMISDKEENINEADYLVLTKEVSEGFLSKFSRVFYFYDPLNLDVAKKLAKKYKAKASKFESYKKENGKWIKDSITVG
jgi:DNA polymerase IIIc chi subunit